jgi:HK97 family phage portal protein
MNAFGRLLCKLGATPPPDNDFWYRPTSGSKWYVSADSAMRVAAVWACVRVIAETIGSMPCAVYRRTSSASGDGRQVDRNHPLYYLLHDAPNPDMSAFEFWELAAKCLCLQGNFYARIVTNLRGDVVRLVPLSPTDVRVARDKETGVLVYTYNQETFTASDVLHIPGLGYDGESNLIGYSPVTYMAQSIGMTQDAEGYGANFFRNNATPPAYMSVPQALSNEARQNLKNWLLDNYGGVKNAGKIGVLEQGAEIKTVPINHRDMQFLELRQFQKAEICSVFRVPPHMIQDLTRSTNNNIEHQGIDFATHTIRPWLTRIEKRINMQLFGPREAASYYAEFLMDALLRGDAASRATFYSSMRNIGVLNANEIRAKENMNPYVGGERYLVQGAMIPVEQAGREVVE